MRWFHRELGFLFFGMTLVYAVSGIALNHGVARHWDPGIISRSESFTYPSPLSKENVDREVVSEILDITGESGSFKNYFFPTEEYLMIYLKGGHITLELSSGNIQLTRVRNRPVFSELNYLHYNKAKKLWTWFSDLFALSLFLLALTGLFMLKARQVLRGRALVMLSAGILIPLIFLFYYLWF